MARNDRDLSTIGKTPPNAVPRKPVSSGEIAIPREEKEKSAVQLYQLQSLLLIKLHVES